AALFIGIDSGPCKIAFAVGCPTVAVWTGHHPLHYADRTEAVHLLPWNHEGMIRGSKEDGLRFFQKHYQAVAYRNVAPELGNQIAKKLGLNPMARAGLLTAQGFDEDYYRQHQEAGLDYLNFGEWQQRYGRWIVETLGMAGKTVLDVGCA